jgi:hypothetical protein
MGLLNEAISSREMLDMEAARAECAVAKFLGVSIRDKYIQDNDDVSGYQVRGTRHSNGSLIIYDSDNDKHPFILVTGTNGSYVLCGWLYGWEGKRTARSGPYGRLGHWNRQEELHPMRTLPSLTDPPF